MKTRCKVFLGLLLLVISSAQAWAECDVYSAQVIGRVTSLGRVAGSECVVTLSFDRANAWFGSDLACPLVVGQVSAQPLNIASKETCAQLYVGQDLSGVVTLRSAEPTRLWLQ